VCVTRHVYRIKPTSIADWKAVVECIDPDISRKSCASARTRFEMMMMLYREWWKIQAQNYCIKTSHE